MALLDLLGRRWALRIVAELAESPASFNELQDRCEQVSPSVLSQRLDELANAGLVARSRDRRYSLTPRARELGRILLSLDSWAKRWAASLAREGGGGRKG